MQKIDFVLTLKTIVEKLDSNKILVHFNAALEKPTHAYDFSKLAPLLFASKSKFDELRSNVIVKDILERFGGTPVYSEDNLATLVSYFKQLQPNEAFAKANVIALFNFHHLLSSTFEVLKEVLLHQNFEDRFEDSVEKNIIIFRIVSGEKESSIGKLSNIFDNLNQLVHAISKMHGESDIEPVVLMLDSGSDTNVVLKTGVETAKSLFDIFKTVWDFITNHKIYREKQKIQTLIESLSAREEIQKKIKDGVITEDEGKTYLHYIKTRTDKLLELKVIPKDIVDASSTMGNRQLLLEMEKVPLLNSENQPDVSTVI